MVLRKGSNMGEDPAHPMTCINDGFTFQYELGRTYMYIENMLQPCSNLMYELSTMVRRLHALGV
jgi:hypothetical protein